LLRLNKIELKGFKSFAAPTCISVEDNLLGVVGPNGAGKSNLLDAIHFVFGEQKPSVMRVSKVSDVIFNGTQTEPAHGLASVALEFEVVSSAKAEAVVGESVSEGAHFLETSGIEGIEGLAHQIEGGLAFDEGAIFDESISYASAPPGSELSVVEGGAPEAGIADAEDLEPFIPENLTPGDVIILRRVVYRDGESEYYLNDLPVKLSQIDHFFSRFQLGRLAPFTINQGEVERKLLASPNEIREWLGEASGVAILLRAKSLTERRLARAEQNLTRVKDILSTLKGEVSELELQAIDARRALYLENLLFQLRGRLLSEKLLSALKKKEKVLSQRENYKERTFNLTVSIETERRTIEELEGRKAELESTRKEKEANLALLKDEESHLVIAESILEERLKGARLRQNELSERRGEEEARLREIERELEEIQAEVAEKETSLRSILKEEDELKAKLGTLEDALAKAIKEFDVLAEQLMSLEKQSLVIQERLRSLQGEKANLERALISDRKSASQLEKEISDLRAQKLETEKEVKELESVLASKEAELSSLSSSLDSIRQEILDNEKVRADVREKLSALRTAHDHYDELKAEFYRLEQELTGELLVTPILDLIAFSREWSEAVVSALGETASGYVCMNESEKAKIADADASGIFVFPTGEGGSSEKGEQAKSLDQKEGVESAPKEEPASQPAPESAKGELPYESLWDRIQGRADVISSLRNALGEFAIAETVNEGWELLAKFPRVSAVVIRGKSMLLRRGLIKKGVGAKDKALFTKHSELPILKQRISELENSLVKLRDKSLALEREETSLSSSFSEAEKSLKNLRSELSEKKSQLSYLSASLSALEEKRALLEHNIRAEESRLGEVEADLASLEVQSSSVKSTLKEIESQKASYESELASLRSSSEDVSAKLQHLSEKKSALVSRLSFLKTTASKLGSEKSGIEAELDILENSLLQVSEEAEKQATEKEEVSAKLLSLREKISAEELSLSRVYLELEEVQASERKSREELSSLEGSLKKITTGATEYDSKVWEAEREVAEIFREINHHLGVSLRTLFERLAESRRGGFCAPSIQPSDFFPVYGAGDNEEFNPQEGEAYPLLFYDDLQESAVIDEISRAEKALANLGKINPLAPREYEEKKVRFENFTREREELLALIKELRSALVSLDEKTKSHFAKSLRLIEGKFNELFVRLFGGGFARFRLTDPSDITTSGIEIEVQLPGGRTQNIRALSGGERSLLFIALFLAVHITRPGSFCVLDEVDSALDDVNVSRFTRLLEELSDKEQFIVITHNKNTMRVMKQLVGVVNQPKGISRIIEVSLKQAESFADKGAA